MWHNVENLFDTCHDYGKDDKEFLPGGGRKWDSRKFWKKLGLLSKTIVAAGEVSPPDLVGLCEVENDSAATSLLRKTYLNRLGYEYV